MGWTLSLLVFSILTLWIGWRASHGINTLKSFLVSDQNFGKFALFSTIVASFVGGGVVIGTAEKAFQFGIGHTIGLLGFALQIFLTGWWLAPRMNRFRHMLTLGEVIHQYYGKVPQVLTGVLWLSFCIGILTAQMSAMGNLITSLMGYDRPISILLSASIVIFYCYLGGVRAVIATDVLQFVLLSVTLGMLTLFGIHYVGGWEVFLAKIPASHLSPTAHLSLTELLMLFGSFLLGDALIPPVFQRLIIGKNQDVVRKAYIWSGWFIIPLCFLALSHGLIARAINPNLATHDITATLFQTTLPLPLAILALMGFMAVIMSSADSYLNAAAGVLVNDVISPIKKISQEGGLELAKWTTIGLGLVSIYFAIVVQDILDILLTTYQFWGPTLVIPLLGILSNKALTKAGFYASVISGGLVVILWNTWDLESTTHISTLIAGIGANFMVYSGCYMIQKYSLLTRMAQSRG